MIQPIIPIRVYLHNIYKVLEQGYCLRNECTHTVKGALSYLLMLLN